METNEFLIKTLDEIFEEMKEEKCGFEWEQGSRDQLLELLYKIHDYVFSAKKAIKIIELFEK